ncbi:MAG: ImmA/IrrE family metallo-endopeptidase, partial [Methanobacteriota archaeon]
MGAKMVDVDVNVVIKIIDQSNKRDELPKQLKQLLPEWESGKKKPTISQLRILARSLKRPFAEFFMQEPLPDPSADTRRYRFNDTIPLSFKSSLAIRDANAHLEELVELLEEPIAILPKASIKDDPKTIAETLKQKFKLHIARKNAKDKREYFKIVRNILENNGIFVFQYSLPLDELRGFSIWNDKAAVIACSTKDEPESRTFTLMHELGHLILRNHGICDIQLKVEWNDVETWCNRFAGYILIDINETLKQEITRKLKELNIGKVVEKYASHFKVSKAAIAKQLEIIKLISHQEFIE